MIFDLLANIIFPPVCLACDERVDRGVICESCFTSIALRAGFLCGECHAKLVSYQSPCHPDFPYILGAATNYADESVQSLIHHLKFRFIKSAAEPLTDLIVHYLETAEASAVNMSFAATLRSENFIVVPIPLSARRRRMRGFNQAELIARGVADELGLPVLADVLIRPKHAKPQSDTTSAAERKENIRGAFAIRESGAATGRGIVCDALLGANILLLDDVSTSGATFLEASLALKTAGAEKILAVAVAKT